MQAHIDYHGLKAVTSNTSDYHAMSLQDTLDVGKPTPTSTRALKDTCSKVYRPVVGFYRNTYITDDFGNSVQVSSKEFGKVSHFIFS